MFGVLRTILAILGSVLFGVSTALTIEGVAEIMGVHISLPILNAVGFGLFAGAMVWAVFDLQARLRACGNRKPLINATFGLAQDTYYIDVRNDGEAGDFECQVQVVDTTEPKLELFWGRYNGLWVGSEKTTIAIAKGVTRRILLATIEQAQSYLGAHLRFYRVMSGRIDQLDTHSYTIGVPQLIVPEASLTVIISSIPSPRDGEVCLLIKLRADYEWSYTVMGKKDKKQTARQITKDEFHKLLDKASKPVKKSGVKQS